MPKNDSGHVLQKLQVARSRAKFNGRNKTTHKFAHGPLGVRVDPLQELEREERVSVDDVDADRRVDVVLKSQQLIPE